MAEHAEQTRFRRTGHWFQGTHRGQGTFGDLDRGRILHQVGCRRLVAEALSDHLQVAYVLEVCARGRGKPPPDDRLRLPQVRHRHQQSDPRRRVVVWLAFQGRLADFDRARVVTGDQAPLHLRDTDDVGPLLRINLQEEVDRTAGPLVDQLEGLAGRLGFPGLDEVDRGPADVVSRDLAEAEPGLLACLLDRTRPDLDAATPAATAARGGLPLPARAIRRSRIYTHV